jgi:SNF2 family DNA or RNA helicase
VTEFGSPVWHAFGLPWPQRLFPYQQTGIEMLVREPAVLLADEMGLGKTIQAIGALRVLAARGECGAALVVVPSGLVLQWRRQFRHWAPELGLSTVIGPASDRLRAWRAPAQMFIVGYESLRSDFWLNAPGAPGRREWDVVVLDEAQRIKTAHSELAGAVKRLSRVRSWALTGTPLENRLDDLLSVLDFVAPGRFDPKQKAVGLRRLLAEVQLRRRRRDVLQDLPPKTSSTVRLDLGRRQRAAYVRAEEEGIVRLEAMRRELRITHVLELILRLKQICNFCPETGESAKLDDMLSRIETVVGAGEKALVFSQFVAEPFGTRRLAQELARFEPLVLAGDVHPAARAARIAEFERDPSRPVLLLSLRAGGVGLNLTSASYVFHFDRWWNPAVEAQAEDRAHRIGQERPVHTYAYLCERTIEERIQEILEAKRALFADVVDGVSASALRRLDLDTLLAAVKGTT